MRMGSRGFQRRLVVLSTLCGIGIVPPALSQPANFDVVEASIDSIQAAMRAGRLSCAKLVQTYLDRIAAMIRLGPSSTPSRTSILMR